MYTFYSQGGEDILIYSLFINQPNVEGRFLEIGGFDGITFSNTKFFEDNLGYTGILIEPTENYFEMVKNRPNCKCYRTAIDTEERVVEFIGNGCSAGIEKNLTDDFKNFHHRHSGRHFYNACPMNFFIKKEDVPYLDLFILDVEGSELKVLETFDFSIPVYLFEVELHGDDKEKDDKCREILKANGFKFVTRLYSNEFWINESYFRKDLLYKKPSELKPIQSIGTYPCVDPKSKVLEDTEATIRKHFNT